MDKKNEMVGNYRYKHAEEAVDAIKMHRKGVQYSQGPRFPRKLLEIAKDGSLVKFAFFEY